MSVEISGLPSRSVSSAGDGNKTRAVEQNKSNSSGAPQRTESGGGDKVSLTDTATRLQELESHIASLPVADVQHVTDVQRSLASGSFQFKPVEAANNLLTQERDFALISEQG
ncbi:MAG: flagellar biosynthesis anti-sigma factor FlgM [Candidatus Sedimenticola sp. (ex Thyasira tokunagai)]